MKIKDKESDTLSWNNISITFKFKNGVLLNFWLKGNNLKYTIFSVLEPISACKECEMYNLKATELNNIDIAPIYSDIIEKINKLYEYSKNAIDCTSINFRNPESIIEES